jgi:hypothetical protein
MRRASVIGVHQDTLLMMCIRREIFEAFWYRKPSAVEGKNREAKVRRTDTVSEGGMKDATRE